MSTKHSVVTVSWEAEERHPEEIRTENLLIGGQDWHGWRRVPRKVGGKNGYGRAETRDKGLLCESDWKGPYNSLRLKKLLN